MGHMFIRTRRNVNKLHIHVRKDILNPTVGPAVGITDKDLIPALLDGVADSHDLKKLRIAIQLSAVGLEASSSEANDTNTNRWPSCLNHKNLHH